MAIQRVACHVHSWNAECDRRIVRLYEYINSHTDLVLTGELSSADADCLVIHAWPDADLNGDAMHTKSTGGIFVEVMGGGERSMPLLFSCKKHESTSLHTPESELVTLATYMRNEVLPLQELWQRILQKPIHVVVHEDNTAAITIVRKGYSPSLRCLPRTHRTSIGVVHETFHEPPPPGCGECELIYVESTKNKGDLMTKYLDRPALEKALEMIQVVPKGTLESHKQNRI